MSDLNYIHPLGNTDRAYRARDMSKVSAALSKIQRELNVPKKRRNDFGNFMYRSAEDILEAVKNIMPEGACLTVTDDVVLVGDRTYIRATASFTLDDGNVWSTGFAREPLSKKGSDESQITGAASSYARKYALNGLFAIDDSRDADSEDNRQSGHVQEIPKRKEASPHKQLSDELIAIGITKESVVKCLALSGYSKLKDLPENRLSSFKEGVIQYVNQIQKLEQ